MTSPETKDQSAQALKTPKPKRKTPVTPIWVDKALRDLIKATATKNRRTIVGELRMRFKK